MPAVTAWITPQTPIKAWDHLYGGHRQIAGVTFDDVNVHLGGIGDDAGDVGIIAACDKLVAAILDIRGAAFERIERQERTAHEAAEWAESVTTGTYVAHAPLADPGDHYVGMPE